MKIEDFTGKFGVGDAAVAQAMPVSQKTTRPIEPERLRPEASFKINDSLRQATQVQPLPKVNYPVQEKAAEVVAREPIDAVGVAAALEQYIALHHSEPTVEIALKTHTPEIDGEKIIIAVDNQLQLDKLENLHLHLTNQFMKILNNGFLSLELKLFDARTSTEEKKLFTAGEKYEHFLQLNPLVANLKALFGLELE